MSVDYVDWRAESDEPLYIIELVPSTPADLLVITEFMQTRLVSSRCIRLCLQA